ncbi:MAG: hypothetical protein AAGA37_07200 [Actinomycetota bacterium]
MQANRETTIGLHHLALRVPDLATLHAAFAAVQQIDRVEVEFAPQQNPIGIGPPVHVMVFEPSGNRIEVVCDP